MSVELLLSIVGAIATVIGGYWALAKTVVAQFNVGLDTRFASLEEARREGRKQFDERFRHLEQKQEEIERDMRSILVELPRDYTRREDHIRDIGTIALKIENLALNVERNLQAQASETRNLAQLITQELRK